VSTVDRTEPRSPIEEQLLRTIARLDGRLWKRSDRERQERNAEVIMRTAIGPALERERERFLQIAADQPGIPDYAHEALARTLTSEEA
jgi:hypothetical protein